MCEFINILRDDFSKLEVSQQNDMINIERIANEIRIYFKQASYPVDIIEIAGKIGFNIYQGPFQNPEESAKILIDETLEEILDNENYIGDKIIIVNEKDTSYHQNFSIAHVIGQYIFDYQNNGLPYYYSYITNSDRNEFIMRANRFAAALLLPEEIFKTQYEFISKGNGTLYDILNKLSEMFLVSPEAVRRRFQELEININK